jgi:Leucine-rich repeat (LRR) protein
LKGTPKIENGVVTKIGFATDNVTDISPLHALVEIRTLNCSGSALGKGRLSDLSPLKGMQLTNLTCGGSKVTDLSPLEGMRLTNLNCGNSALSDLSPLKGMPLTQLNCSSSYVADLSPLRGMPLNHLDCYGTKVGDLSPLRGMPLTVLTCMTNAVTDLSPLEGMQLANFNFFPTRITKGMEVLRPMKSLKAIGVGQKQFTTADFWKKYDAGEFGKPATPANLACLDPAFQAWVKATQALPAEKQIEAVSKKLVELNPGFDGQVRGYYGNPAKIENGVVTEIVFFTDNVTDISPVRVFSELKRLACTGRNPRSGKMSDLSPLQGMKLTEVGCQETQVSDLLPLKGMKLTRLICTNTQVSDLSPLREIPLTVLDIQNTPLVNLSPLQGVPLKAINCNGSHVSDLTPLHNCMALETAAFYHTKVTPAQVAALQKALPNCKIEWDGPAKPKPPEPTASGTK